MDTTNTPTKKKSNTLWYVLGALGLLAIFSLSSFTTAGGSVDTSSLTPCQSDPDCLKAYYKWTMIKGWYKDIIAKAVTNGTTTAQQLDADAQYFVDIKQPIGADMADWTAQVTAEITRVKAITPNLSLSDARYVAMQNILTRLTA